MLSKSLIRFLNRLKQLYCAPIISEGAIVDVRPSSSSFCLTSNFYRIGFKIDPTTRIVNNEKIRVSVRINGPISSSVELLRASA